MGREGERDRYRDREAEAEGVSPRIILRVDYYGNDQVREIAFLTNLMEI